MTTTTECLLTIYYTLFVFYDDTIAMLACLLFDKRNSLRRPPRRRKIQTMAASVSSFAVEDWDRLIANNYTGHHV